MPAGLGQVQARCGRDTLVGGDVARQAAAGVRGVVGGTDREAMAQGGAPGRVGEGLLGLQTQAVARHDPADAIDQAGLHQPGGSHDGKQRLASAWSDGGEDVTHVRLPGSNGRHDAGELALVGAERACGQDGLEGMGKGV